uniref:LAGLIDADG homing endonuclease n=1 Tax=Termitomyces sp. TaxID=1916073 RepID=A0A386TYP9_9AGAR|nr:LAGLIDADG homing endonuclease [Termitomyces sp.]
MSWTLSSFYLFNFILSVDAYSVLNLCSEYLSMVFLIYEKVLSKFSFLNEFSFALKLKLLFIIMLGVLLILFICNELKNIKREPLNSGDNTQEAKLSAHPYMFFMDLYRPYAASMLGVGGYYRKIYENRQAQKKLNPDEELALAKTARRCYRSTQERLMADPVLTADDKGASLIIGSDAVKNWVDTLTFQRLAMIWENKENKILKARIKQINGKELTPRETNLIKDIPEDAPLVPPADSVESFKYREKQYASLNKVLELEGLFEEVRDSSMETFVLAFMCPFPILLFTVLDSLSTESLGIVLGLIFKYLILTCILNLILIFLTKNILERLKPLDNNKINKLRSFLTNREKAEKKLKLYYFLILLISSFLEISSFF